MKIELDPDGHLKLETDDPIEFYAAEKWISNFVRRKMSIDNSQFDDESSLSLQMTDGSHGAGW